MRSLLVVALTVVPWVAAAAAGEAAREPAADAVAPVVTPADVGPPTDGAPPEDPPSPTALTPSAPQAALDAHNALRRRQQVEAMGVLLGWSVGNIAVGAGGWALADDVEWRSFHQMSIAWNGINVAIALPGLIGGLREQTSGLDLATTLRRSAQLKTSFAFNAGLDVGWVALGAWMAERGLRTEDARFTGFGRSMMLQGGFLLVFDTVLLVLRTRADKGLLVGPAFDPVSGTIGVQGRF